MDEKKFKALLQYYLSCMDAEGAAYLRLRKDQENKSYIFADNGEEERFFSQSLPELRICITDKKQLNFIQQRALSTETLVDLYYGFPVFLDKKGMLTCLFYIGVEAYYTDERLLHLLPKKDTLSINRAHFLEHYDTEEAQSICAELEGEFGSFETRLKAAEAYLPSLKDKTGAGWLKTPVLFRANVVNAKEKLRYDLTYLLQKDNILQEETALKFFVAEISNTAGQRNILERQPSVLEISALNMQQEEAVVKGLLDPLSVITGPPGTGKTQVVTALLASAVFNNQTVLFASNNNMPVDGVYERLGQSMMGLGNWIMRLGNQIKKEACQKHIFSLLERLQASAVYKKNLAREREGFADLESRITKTLDGLNRARSLEDKIGKYQLRENAIAQRLPAGWVQYFENKELAAFDAGFVKKFKRHNAPGFWLWVRRKLFEAGTFRQKHNDLLVTLLAGEQDLTARENLLLIDESWDQSIEKATNTTRYILLHQDWVRCASERKKLDAQIALCPSMAQLTALKKEKSALSQTLFDQGWLNDISGSVHEATSAFNGYFKDVDDFGSGRYKRLEKSLESLKKFFPIWITTSQSANTVMPPQAGLFDMVVIDEAGQCDIPSVLPLLYRAKRAVLIGDPKQFKHITSLQKGLDDTLAKRMDIVDIADDWSFTRRSAYDRAFSATQSASFLKQHYRCHPDIIEFSNHNFYDGKLATQVPLLQFKNRLPIEESGLIWHHVSGTVVKGETGASNPAEVEKTIEIFERWAQQGLFSTPNLTFGIITPFRKQAEEMRKALSPFPWFKAAKSRFTIGTAHSFQGSECDVLVYSPVVAHDMDSHLVKFAAGQAELMNVTVTRAKNLLYIIGDMNACQASPAHTPLRKLADYAEALRKQQQYPLNTVEKAMADIMDALQLSYTAQYACGQYRLDFVVNAPSGERYDLEVDGDIHLSPEAVHHDERRDSYVSQQGFKVLRFSARDIFNKPDAVKERLMRI